MFQNIRSCKKASSKLTAVAGLAMCLGVATQAKADAVVPGSTFDVVIGTYDGTTSSFNYSQLYTVTANTSTGVTYDGVRGPISESETVLSTGQTKVAVSFMGSAPLFTETGSTDDLFAFLAIGAYGNPMDFTAPFNLSSAVLNLTTPSGTSGFNVLPNIAQTQPFSGSVLNTGHQGIYIGPLQNLGVTAIELDLTNDAAPAVTPEPSSLALLGTGILGIAGMARRRFTKAA